MINAPNNMADLVIWHYEQSQALERQAQAIFNNVKCMPADLQEGRDKQEMARFHAAATLILERVI